MQRRPRPETAARRPSTHAAGRPSAPSIDSESIALQVAPPRLGDKPPRSRRAKLPDGRTRRAGWGCHPRAPKSRPRATLPRAPRVVLQARRRGAPRPCRSSWLARVATLPPRDRLPCRDRMRRHRPARLGRAQLPMSDVCCQAAPRFPVRERPFERVLDALLVAEHLVQGVAVALLEGSEQKAWGLECERNDRIHDCEGIRTARPAVDAAAPSRYPKVEPRLLASTWNRPRGSLGRR
jgi:hypothetical protein